LETQLNFGILKQKKEIKLFLIWNKQLNILDTLELKMYFFFF